MKSARVSAVLVGSALLFAGSVFAGPATNKKTLHLTDSVVVEGKQLPPGDYKAQWNDAGPDVQVSILRGNDTVATFSAHVVAVNHSNAQDGYSTTANQDGSKTLKLLFFSGKKYELDVESASVAAPSQTSDAGRPN